jgi:hypothetical protein
MTATTANETVIRCGGMGAHDDWDKNTRKAERDGVTTTCEHCGKGMAENTGYIARWEWMTDTLLPLTSEQGKVIRLGNNCVKNFWSADTKDTHFAKAGA